MTRLTGKVCIVTGAQGAIGTAIVETFLQEGAIVCATDLIAPNGPEERRAGHAIIAHDVTREQDWQSVISDVEQRHGRLDVLVNNAGIIGSTSRVTPETIEIDDFRRIQAVNVEGVLLGCRCAIPAMRRAGGGSIINLSSLAGIVPTAFEVGYGISKAAVRQLTWSVAAHVGRDRIRCNAVLPGQIETGAGGMMDRIFQGMEDRAETTDKQTAQDTFAGLIPLGYRGSPGDVAKGVLFLASDDARYITGTSLLISGGMGHL